MANEVEIRVTGDSKQAEKSLKGIRAKLDNFSATAKKAGLALSVMGGAGVLAIKGFINAALEQERAMKTLGATVEASGTSFDSVRAKIEATTAALQDKTSFGDEEQLRVLAQLVPVFGNIDDALTALPIIMDAAASSGKSLETVASTMGRALSGATNVSIILGETFDKNATFAERLAIATTKVGGAAEANADPMIQFSNTMGDLKETIGAQLLPIIIPLIRRFGDIVKSISNMNPTLLKVVTLVGLLATAFAAIGGPILLFIGFLPAIISGVTALGAAITIATGPIGLIALGITAAIAAGVLIVKNWDTIKAAAQRVFGFIHDLYRSKLGWLLPGGPFIKAILFIKDNWKDLWDGAVVTLKAAINAIIGMLNALIEALNSIQVAIPSWVPKFGGKTFGINIPEIPELQRGGIVQGPTVARIGEAGPEAIIPLDGSARSDAFIQKLASAIGGTVGGGPIVLMLDGQVIANALGVRTVGSEHVRAQ